MEDLKMELGKNPQNVEFIEAKRKLDRIALERAIEEYKKDNSIDFSKRKKEIFQELLLKFKKDKEEKDLLVGANKLVDKYSNIDERYKDLISKEAIEKLAIRKEADKILEQLKKEQKEKQAKKINPSVSDKNAEAKKKIEDIRAVRKKVESLRRANYNEEKKRYEDRQGKVANLVDQLAFINKTSNEPIQNKSTNSIQSTPIQKSSVRSSNIRTQNSITEKVVIKEVESTPKKEENPVQALVPKKQKSSFIERIQKWGIKVADKFSEATMTAYEMLTFKHNRDVAVGKRKERAVSPAEASNAYEKNMKYADSDPTIDVRSKNENKPTSFLEHLQAKADEKVAMEAMKLKSKNEKVRSSDQRGA